MRSVIAVSTLTLAFAAAASQPPAVHPPGSDAVLRRTPAGLLATEVTLAGTQVVAALDTGASLTLVAPALAARLGLVPSARSTVVDASGRERPLLLAAAVPLRWGDLAVALPWVGWTPGAAALPGADGLAAVLGADALAGADVLIDAGRRRLRVAPAGALAAWVDGDPVAVRAIDGRPAIELEVEGGDGATARLPLVIDSGADAVVLFGAAAARAARERSSTRRGATLTTASGAAAAVTVALGRAQAGARALRLGRAVVMPELVDRVEAGLLPLEALGSVRLDLASGSAVLAARLRSRPLP